MKATQKRNPLVIYPIDRRDERSREIQLETQQRARRLSREGHRAIEQRLRELDHEWDIESLLKLQTAAFGLKYLLFGAMVSRKYFWATAGLAALVVQQSVQDWSPPYAIYRKLGKRTRREVQEERYMLEALYRRN